MLPVDEILTRIVLAWYPDYTKLTPGEAKRLELGKKHLVTGQLL